jgi:hypothetical protein
LKKIGETMKTRSAALIAAIAAATSIGVTTTSEAMAAVPNAEGTTKAVQIWLRESGPYVPPGVSTDHLIRENGKWTVTYRKGETEPPQVTKGRLTDGDREELQSLATYPQFAREAATTRGLCGDQDGDYTLQAGKVTLDSSQTCTAALAKMPTVQRVILRILLATN